jgi:hypothetical protein
MPMVRVLAVIVTRLYLRGDVPPLAARGGGAAEVLERSETVHRDTVQCSLRATRQVPTPTVQVKQ